MTETKEESPAKTEAPAEPTAESNGADAMEVDEAKEASTEDKPKEDTKTEENGEDKEADSKEKEEDAEEKEEVADAEEKEEKEEDAEEKEEEVADAEEKEEEVADAEEKEEEGKTEEDDAAMDGDGDDDGDGKETTTPKKRGKPSTPSSAPSSSKRQRKAPTFLEPKNFKLDKENSKDIVIPKGRGTALKDIEVIKNNISKLKPKDPVLGELHKFLLGGSGGLTGKGRTPAKSIRPHILEFSGYIPNELEGETDEEKKELEEEIEERFQEKVKKLKLPLIKTFLDVLGLGRGPENGKVLKKEDLSEKLLEFLLSPNAESVQMKARKKRGRPAKAKEVADKETPKKRRGRPPKAKKVEEEQVSEEEEEKLEEGKVPSDKMLKKWVKAYVTCFNLDKATANHAVQTASDKFGVDMDEKKGEIMEMLKEAMSK